MKIKALIIKTNLMLLLFYMNFTSKAQDLFLSSGNDYVPEVNATNEEWVKPATKKYSPQSWNLLSQYEKLPAKQKAFLNNGGVVTSQKPVPTFNYLEGNSKKELLLTMATNVHEIAHALYRQNAFQYVNKKGLAMNWENAEGFISISTTRSFFISFPRKSLFPASKLSEVIPDTLQTYRYSTYVTGNNSTQEEGIIGLLDEFHAYYLGAKYTFEMLEAYKIAMGSDAVGFYTWVSHAQSSMSAFYEFDFFIREYLRYMKINYPVDYNLLKSNKSFSEAYQTVRAAYQKLTNDYMNITNNQIQFLNSSGKTKLSLTENILWMKMPESKESIGTSFFSKDKDKIASILESGRYQLIENDLPFSFLR